MTLSMYTRTGVRERIEKYGAIPDAPAYLGHGCESLKGSGRGLIARAAHPPLLVLDDL